MVILVNILVITFTIIQILKSFLKSLSGTNKYSKIFNKITKMSSMTFSQKTFQTVPPTKGSFPLDHSG